MSARFALIVDRRSEDRRRIDSSQPLPDIVAALNAHRPDQLFTTPTVGLLLAFEQLEGRLAIAPQIVATSSEPCTAEMRTTMHRAWGNVPFDRYATTEGLFAGDCSEHAGLHIFEDLGHVEVVDEDGRDVPDGEVGHKLLFTSFIRKAQPVVRYEITDIVAVTSAPCACGRTLRRITAFEGRVDDILRLGARNGGTAPVLPITLYSAMTHCPEIKAYRIVHDPDGLAVEVVLRDGADAGRAAEQVVASLEAALSASGAAYVSIRVTAVAAFRLEGHARKFKRIESRIR